MEPIIKNVAKDSANWAINSVNPSNETNIKITSEIAMLFGRVPVDGESIDVEFFIFKEDFIKSLCCIFASLPLVRSQTSKLVNFSKDLFNEDLNVIEVFFGNEDKKEIKASLAKPVSHSLCLNFGKGNFPIREYLLEKRSQLVFSKDANNRISVRVVFDSNLNEEKNNILDLIQQSTLQKIYFGSPGSGKSHKVDEIYQANKNNGTCFRTIFHPDSDYSTFVGCYKPISKKESLLGCKNLTENEILDCFFDSKDETKYPNAIKARYWYEALKNREDIKNLGLTASSIASKLTSKGFDKTAYTSEVSCIFSIFDWLKNDGYLSNTSLSYEFVPQVFTDAYVKAWEDTSVPVYLIIEEINRGNCAQVFGDLFQLLDRTNGVSDYPINADHDLRAYLEEKLGVGHEGIKDGKLKLPANLNILATMNTSDQSLFPMDSAFKRRWEWEYVPINYSEIDDDGKPLDSYNFTITFGGNKYRWIDFLKKVNNKIKDVTKSEDKQMGNFFIKHDVDEKEFCNKVMFYLWNDVAKDYYESNDNLFQTKENHEDENGKSTKHFSYNELFGENCTKLLEGFFKMLDVKQFEEAGGDDGVPGGDD